MGVLRHAPPRVEPQGPAAPTRPPPAQCRATQLALTGKLDILIPPLKGYHDKHEMGPEDSLRGLTGVKRDGWIELITKHSDRNVLLEVNMQEISYEKDYYRKVRKVLTETLAIILDVDESLIHLAHPDIPQRAVSKRDHTASWLLHDAPPGGADTLRQHPVWPTRKVTFHVFRGVIGQNPRFFGSWKGMQLIDYDRARAATVTSFQKDWPIEETASTLR